MWLKNHILFSVAQDKLTNITEKINLNLKTERERSLDLKWNTMSYNINLLLIDDM